MRSETDIPWRPLGFAVLALAALVAAAVYCTRVHSEVRFCGQALQVKRAHCARLVQAARPRMILAGGSSCAFGLDPGLIQERLNVPAVNLGLHAGLGARVLVSLALREARPGDVFVLALEPTILCSDWEPTALGQQFSLSLGEPELLSEPGKTVATMDVLHAGLALRPGARHCAVALARFVTRKPQGRYSLSEVHTNGWQQNDLRWDVHPFSHADWRLPAEAQRWLGYLRDRCASNQVTLVYSLPWAYVSEGRADEMRRRNSDLLVEISKIVPVLDEPEYGVLSDRTRFLDTEWHLDGEGARRRTSAFAVAYERWAAHWAQP